MKTYLLMLASLTCLNASAEDGAASALSHLRCEGLETPNLVDTAKPRFSWQMESKTRGAMQKAYQLRLTELAADGKEIGKLQEGLRIESDQSQWVEMPKFTAKPNTRYAWQVRIWDQDQKDSGWSTATPFETSLLGEKWQAEWLSDGVVVPNGEAPPARYFRKSFELTAKPVRAKLYLSSFGVTQPWLNGKKVTNDHFLPGWPDYTKRNFYVAYDVTEHLNSGKNAIGLVLGDGWYSGRMWPKNQYGPTPKVSAWLEITDSEGKSTLISTDASWQYAHGPILANGIYFGENYDARKENADWSTNTPANWTWNPVKVEPAATVPLVARYSQPVRSVEELKPVSQREVSPGVHVYDLGQNLVGWVRLKAKASAGQEIKIRFAEMLNPDGTIYVGNLRQARATAIYTAKGEGVETWEPTFTFFGFRYVEITGVEKPLDDAIAGVVVHSDLPRIGHFECSDSMLNKLYSNTLWGQKGNFLELPTDCPQRDERVGWTGDAQVFCHTANFNMASGAFYRQWCAALRDSFKEGKDGGYGDVAPVTGGKPGSAGWGDAGVIIPWVTYLHTGDRRILEDNFEIAQRWIDQQKQFNPDGIRRSKQSYGDWLAPGFPAKKAPTPYQLIATAYFAHSTHVVAQIAEVLGKPKIAKQNLALFEKIKAAFQKEYITADGKITSDTQTAYLLALGFDLVSKELRPQVAQHLAAAFAVKDNHLATGFIGTPLITPVLTDLGLSDLAYKVVLKETYPGWLFSVKNGATTIWERWDSWTPKEGFSKDGMNSFNHYAYGSVCGWFYDSIAGLKLDESAAGWKRFEISPIPGGGLTHAKAILETPYGLAMSSWKIEAGQFSMSVTIPANTQATVRIPAASVEKVSSAGKPLASLGKASASDGRVAILLGAGTYEFEVK
jgi:alpha-L-rhamnosidase